MFLHSVPVIELLLGIIHCLFATLYSIYLITKQNWGAKIAITFPRSSNKQASNKREGTIELLLLLLLQLQRQQREANTSHIHSHSLSNSNTYWYNGSSTSKSATGVSSMLSSIMSFSRDVGRPETNRIVSTTTFDADFGSTPFSVCLFTYTSENKSVSFHRVPDKWRNSSRLRKGEI